MPTRTEWVLPVKKEAIQFSAEAPICTSVSMAPIEGAGGQDLLKISKIIIGFIYSLFNMYMHIEL